MCAVFSVNSSCDAQEAEEEGSCPNHNLGASLLEEEDQINHGGEHDDTLANHNKDPIRRMFHEIASFFQIDHPKWLPEGQEDATKPNDIRLLFLIPVRLSQEH